MKGKFYVLSGFIIKKVRYPSCISNINLNKIATVDAFKYKNARS